MVSREDMEVAELDDNDIHIIKNVELTGDGYPLFNCFLSNGGDISAFTEALPEKEALISNALQILSDLIQAYSINEELSLHLTKPVLFLAVDEKSSVNSIKRAIHVFNLLLQNPSVISSIAYDESLEGSLQILGRKVPSIGDYECQALFFEALYRITCEQNREYWANIWFSDAIARTMFMSLDPQQFESNCRKALNYINRNETNRRVFSFIANTVKFGSFELTEPLGCDFWIDFNYDSQSISFYCSELSNEAAENSGYWETILISASAVKSYHIKINVDKSKKLVIRLNCPCYTLITSSNVINPALQSYEIIISFWGILDIHKHLEHIFEKGKYVGVAEAEEKRKISDISNAIQVNCEKSYPHFEISGKNRKISEASEAVKILEGVLEDKHVADSELENKRKISDISNVIQINCEKSDLHFEISGKKRKISEALEAVQILEGVSEVFSSEVFPQRKVSHLIDPISIDAHESEDYIPPTGQSEMTRKISNASEVIKIAPELLTEYQNINEMRKISNSSQAIFLDLYENDVFQNSSSYKLNEEIDVEIPLSHKRKISQSTFSVPISLDEDCDRIKPTPQTKKKKKFSKRRTRLSKKSIVPDKVFTEKSAMKDPLTFGNKESNSQNSPSSVEINESNSYISHVKLPKAKSKSVVSIELPKDVDDNHTDDFQQLNDHVKNKISISKSRIALSSNNKGLNFKRNVLEESRIKDTLKLGIKEFNTQNLPSSVDFKKSNGNFPHIEPQRVKTDSVKSLADVDCTDDFQLLNDHVQKKSSISKSRIPLYSDNKILSFEKNILEKGGTKDELNSINKERNSQKCFSSMKINENTSNIQYVQPKIMKSKIITSVESLVNVANDQNENFQFDNDHFENKSSSISRSRPLPINSSCGRKRVIDNSAILNENLVGVSDAIDIDHNPLIEQSSKRRRHSSRITRSSSNKKNSLSCKKEHAVPETDKGNMYDVDNFHKSAKTFNKINTSQASQKGVKTKHVISNEDLKEIMDDDDFCLLVENSSGKQKKKLSRIKSISSVKIDNDGLNLGKYVKVEENFKHMQNNSDDFTNNKAPISAVEADYCSFTVTQDILNKFTNSVISNDNLKGVIRTDNGSLQNEALRDERKVKNNEKKSQNILEANVDKSSYKKTSISIVEINDGDFAFQDNHGNLTTVNELRQDVNNLKDCDEVIKLVSSQKKGHLSVRKASSASTHQKECHEVAKCISSQEKRVSSVQKIPSASNDKKECHELTKNISSQVKGLSSVQKTSSASNDKKECHEVIKQVSSQEKRCSSVQKSLSASTHQTECHEVTKQVSIQEKRLSCTKKKSPTSNDKKECHEVTKNISGQEESLSSVQKMSPAFIVLKECHEVTKKISCREKRHSNIKKTSPVFINQQECQEVTIPISCQEKLHPSFQKILISSVREDIDKSYEEIENSKKGYVESENHDAFQSMKSSNESGGNKHVDFQRKQINSYELEVTENSAEVSLKKSGNLKKSDLDPRPKYKNKKSAYNINSSSSVLEAYSPKRNWIKESDDISNKRTDKEFYTSFKDINASKNQPKKIRLYNLERAPVYDVPPAFKDVNSDESQLSSRNEVPNEDLENMLDKRSIISTGKIVKDHKESSASESRSNKQRDGKHIEQEVVKEKNIELYCEFPESDEDFQQTVNSVHTSTERKEDSPQVQAQKNRPKSAFKRKSESYSLPNVFQRTENVKSSRKPRRAAVTAMRKNKKIFDSTSEVTFDKDDILHNAENSPKAPVTVPVKKRRHSKSHRPFNTDTETGSSEVSWMNKNKTCPLFETPKKSYSEWKRSKKRKLPVEIIADINSAPKLHSFERKKKQARQSVSFDSCSKSKSLGWSDLENFNLTVEKTTKRGSNSFMKMLESDLTSGSNNAFNRNTAERSSQPGSKPHSLDSDVRNRTHSKNAFEENEGDMANMSEDMMYEDISGFNSKGKNNLDTSKLNISNKHDLSWKISSKDCNLLNDTFYSDMIKKKKNHTTTQATSLVECNEDIYQVKQIDKDQVIYPLERIEITGVQDKTDNNQTTEEEEGKHDVLERFLNSVSEYLENTHDPTMIFTSENESVTTSFKRRSSSSMIFNGKQKKTATGSSGQEVKHQDEYDHEDESAMHHLSDASFMLKEQEHKTIQKKHKSHELLKPPSSVKKHKKPDEIEDLNENVSNQKTIPSVDDLCSRLNSSFGMTSFKHMGSHESMSKSTKHRKLHSSSKYFSTPHNSYEKHNMEKRLKGSGDATIDSIYSKHSRPTADSSFHMKNDKKWFDAIATTLSQDANSLTRKLLATVQKYVCEYSSKMKILRKNIAETAKVLEAPTQNTASESKLKGLIKNCRMIRNEVEKSLRKIRSIGLEYFEAEHKCYRKLRKKHIKASRKYISGMKQVTKNATTKLEGNVLSKTKSFLQKFWKMIDSA